MKKDHVCAEFKGNYRSIENFIRSDVIVMDIDNDHTEDASDWITPEKLEELFPNVEYLLAPSRHHLLDKEGKHRYGRAWKRIRDKYASEHPFCELCFERGLAVLVEEIHHKKPLSEGGTHDRSNLIALCKSCHSQIHAKRGDRWG